MKSQMKKLGLAAVLLAVCIFYFCTLNVYGFDPPYTFEEDRCIDPCDQVNWTYHSVEAKSGNCLFVVHFKTKDCPCDPPQQGCVHHQIQITGLEMISSECNEESTSNIMKIGTALVLRKAYTIFNESGTYSYYWVRQPACWEWDDNILIPCQCQSCDEMECCVTWYKVHNYFPQPGLDQTHIEDIVYENSPWEDCGELIGVTCFGLCTNSRVPEEFPIPLPFTDCKFNCNEQWQYHPIQYVDGQLASCYFRVFYATRECNNIDEFKIYRIELEGNCGTNIDDILNKAIRYVLLQLYPGIINYNYIHRMNKCWRNYGGSALVPCSSLCCWAEYEVITYLSEEYLNDSEIHDETGSCGDPCENLCEAQNLARGPLPKKPESEYGWVESNGNAAYIQPNPATGKLEIHFLSEYKGDFRIQIYDAMVNKMLDIPFSKGNEEFILETDVSLYPSGIFYYQITKNGYIMIRDRFIVKH